MSRCSEKIRCRLLTCATPTEAGFPSNFVADPFLYVERDTLFLFFETKTTTSQQGDIGVARSLDEGATWEFLGIALDEAWHLSYPFVFKYENEIYMMPEGNKKKELRLYRATKFPLEWTLEKVLVNKPLIDASLVQYEGNWWIFASDFTQYGVEKNAELEIWHSTSPLGPWTQHKQNPIYKSDKSLGARNGGRIFNFEGSLYRPGQDYSGPLLNVTTNENVRVNVKNNLDEPLLITWDGIQMRMNSWQDGVAGTNCPIPPGWNWTYQFQLKDQIGSFFYFPSLGLQRAAGGFGPITVNNRAVVPVPFDHPDGDITLFIGDWYTRSHIELRNMIKNDIDIMVPDAILINGKAPYRYNTTLVPDGLQYEIVGVEPGKTYRFRVHNVGMSTSLNFRIQNHNMRLVEAEGTYTNQQNFTNLDIHVGQSYAFLVTMDQNASTDYYIVASPRFEESPRYSDITGVAILQYSNSKGGASGPLPDAPNDYYDKYYSMNQAKSIRMNTSAGAARPNPQGSFHYGSINITQTFILKCEGHLVINGNSRSAINGISYSPPMTPLRLADLYNLTGVYKTDFPSTPSNAPARIASSVLNASYKGFLEIIFQNNETHAVQTYHLDGYSFFVVGMDYGEWTPDKRGGYNKWDAISRSTTQVFPGGWTAVLVSLDNVGIWNLRAEKLDDWFRGQEVYVKVADPLGYNITEMAMPDNALYCGRLKDKQKPQAQESNSKSSAQGAARWSAKLLATSMLIIVAVFCA